MGLKDDDSKDLYRPVISPGRKLHVLPNGVTSTDETTVRYNLHNWQWIYGKIDPTRVRQFNKRFGEISAENIKLWRQGQIAPDAAEEFPLYLIDYIDVGDNETPRKGVTDDPLMRDKVRYIGERWVPGGWKIRLVRGVPLQNREQALEEEMHKVDDVKYQATLPYFCSAICKASLISGYQT